MKSIKCRIIIETLTYAPQLLAGEHPAVHRSCSGWTLPGRRRPLHWYRGKLPAGGLRMPSGSPAHLCWQACADKSCRSSPPRSRTDRFRDGESNAHTFSCQRKLGKVSRCTAPDSFCIFLQKFTEMWSYYDSITMISSRQPPFHISIEWKTKSQYFFKVCKMKTNKSTNFSKVWSHDYILRKIY